MTDPKDKEPTLPLAPTLDSPLAQPEIVEAPAATDDPIHAITEAVSNVVSKAEKLAQLREAHEVIEDDSDLNDIFMFVRGGIPLTKEAFLESFPNAKALVITQAQLWHIEACVDNDPESVGNRFVYINASGKKRTVKGDYLEEGPLVIFIEELGDEPATSLNDSLIRKALPSRDLVYKLEDQKINVVINLGTLLKSDPFKDRTDLALVALAALFIARPSENLKDIVPHTTNIGLVRGGYETQGADIPPEINALHGYLLGLQCLNRIKFVEKELEQASPNFKKINRAMVLALNWATILSRGYKDESFLNAVNELRGRIDEK